MREVKFERNYIIHPSGSCLSSFGETKVICTAIIEKAVPSFLKETGQGWLTSEYAMLPGSVGGGRKRRDIMKKDGRSTEIQRLIGRSLRAAVDLTKLGECTIFIDCDVIQADGGTRTAAISGGWLALYDALTVLAEEQETPGPEYYLKGQVAAVSVGIVNGDIICDLNYEQDSSAEVDMNVIKLDSDFIEIQGTGENGVFNQTQLLKLLDSAEAGISEIFKAQRQALGLLK